MSELEAADTVSTPTPRAALTHHESAKADHIVFLSVTVHAARGLQAMDRGGTSDPYCQVVLAGGTVGTTKTISRSLTPQWDESFTVKVDTARMDAVEFALWDHDMLSGDDFLGVAQVTLREVAAGDHEGRSWLSLICGSVEDAGEVCVTVVPRGDGSHLTSLVPDTPALESVLPPGYARTAATLCPLVPLTDADDGGSMGERVLYTVPNIMGDLHCGTRFARCMGRLLLSHRRLVFVEDVLEGEEGDALGDATRCHTIPLGSIRLVQVTREAHELFTTVDVVPTLQVITQDSHTSLFHLCPVDTVSRSRHYVLDRLCSRLTWLVAEGNYTFRAGSIAGRAGVATPRRFSMQEEYERQGVCADENWTITTGNNEFELCETYPGTIAVPKGTEPMLAEVSKYRTKQRLPALTWRHPTNGACLVRSSQPKSGIGQANSKADVQYLGAIRHMVVDKHGGEEAAEDVMFRVVDARPKLNASANRLKGGGHERRRHYTDKALADAKADPRRHESALAVLHGTAAAGKVEEAPAAPDRRGSPRKKTRLAAVHASDSESDEEAERVAQRSRAAEALSTPRRLLEAAGASLLGRSPDLPVATPGTSRLRSASSSWLCIEYADIENIHAMRKSLETLRVARLGGAEHWMRDLGSSRWMKHVIMVVRGGQRIANLITKGEPVLVHCSDGWDRTSQLSALSQLLLDPFYRTIEGFQVLVEKDWCTFGHMFEKRVSAKKAARNAVGESKCGYDIFTVTSQHSPVFLQWLECVWQVMVQHPTRFEFNEDLLLAIAIHSSSDWFGTFLGNCDRARAALGLHASLWELVAAHRSTFVNPSYDPVSVVDHVADPLPHVDLKSVRLWPKLHLRPTPDPTRARPLSVRAACGSTAEIAAAAGTAAVADASSSGTGAGAGSGAGAGAATPARTETGADNKVLSELRMQVTGLQHQVAQLRDENHELRRKVALYREGVNDKFVTNRDGSALEPLLGGKKEEPEGCCGSCVVM